MLVCIYCNVLILLFSLMLLLTIYKSKHEYKNIVLRKKTSDVFPAHLHNLRIYSNFIYTYKNIRVRLLILTTLNNDLFEI